ncbi:unnamed protein product, partial [Heterosigma akashiwo]
GNSIVGKTDPSTMASQQPNEVEEVIKELKQNPGFDGYVVMNNDG